MTRERARTERTGESRKSYVWPMAITITCKIIELPVVPTEATREREKKTNFIDQTLNADQTKR